MRVIIDQHIKKYDKFLARYDEVYILYRSKKTGNLPYWLKSDFTEEYVQQYKEYIDSHFNAKGSFNRIKSIFEENNYKEKTVEL